MTVVEIRELEILFMTSVPFSKSPYALGEITSSLKGRICLCGDRDLGQGIANECTQMLREAPESIVVALEFMRKFSRLWGGTAAYFETMDET